MQKATNNLKKGGSQRLQSLINNIITDLHNLTKILKPISKTASQTNTVLTNRLLLANSKDSLDIVQQLLLHLTHITQVKGITSTLLVVLTKVISFIKFFYQNQQPQRVNQSNLDCQKDMETSVQKIIDIIFIINSKTQQQDIMLRIIQVTYSLIEPSLLLFANYRFLTRIYSVCFSCCLASPTILSISISALFSLTEIIFAQNDSKDLLNILIELLEMLLHNKKANWIQDTSLKSIIWDITLIAVKQLKAQDIQIINENKVLCGLLRQIYEVALLFCFQNTDHFYHQLFKQSVRLDHQKPNSIIKENLADFIKIYKVFIYFSIRFSLQAQNIDEIVPFKKNLDIFHVIYELERSTKLFIYLEGVSLILNYGSNLIFQQQAGIMLIDVFTKLSEQIYHLKIPLQVVWEGCDLRIQKTFSDYTRINWQDYIKLIKTTIVNLRKSIQCNHPEHQRLQSTEQNIQYSQNSSIKQQLSITNNKGLYIDNRWKRLIKCVTHIIRYVTSLNIKEGSNDQAVRKFIMELQFWFIISPNNKTRNIILQQLHQTFLHIENKYQAIKASQCLQICSNIIFGYYDIVNSVGVSIIIKILAYARITYEDGHDFDELDEVCQMSDKFFIEQRIVNSEQTFIKTVDGFIQCANLFLADMQVPTQNQNGANAIPIKEAGKYLRLIEYALIKLKFVIQQNSQFLLNQWNFITSFWVSFCSSKNSALRLKTMAHVGSVITQLQKNGMIHQYQIINTYLQLSKLHIAQISKMVVEQLKSLIINIKDQMALVEILKVIKQIRSLKQMDSLREDVFQLQELLIKDSIFKITSQKCILAVIDCLSFDGKSKNQQYCTVSLLWNISDHIKSTRFEQPTKKGQLLWKQLFKKIIFFAKMSTHPQTKNSCMHSFTQIIAECNPFFGEQLFSSTLLSDYLQTFSILMSFCESQPIFDNIIQLQMQKTAIKNFMKLSKKCIIEKMVNVQKLFEQYNLKLLNSLKNKGSSFSIEYFYQLCTLWTYYRQIMGEDTQKQGCLLNANLIKEIFEVIELNHEKFDKKNYFWKKKYQPQFYQLKQFFRKY